MSCGYDGEYCAVEHEGPRWEALEEVFEDKALTRLIKGALSDCISAHGPITRALLGSAIKRVVTNIQNSVHDRERAKRDPSPGA